jgi:hypothetical protein
VAKRVFCLSFVFVLFVTAVFPVEVFATRTDSAPSDINTETDKEALITDILSSINSLYVGTGSTGSKFYKLAGIQSVYGEMLLLKELHNPSDTEIVKVLTAVMVVVDNFLNEFGLKADGFPHETGEKDSSGNPIMKVDYGKLDILYSPIVETGVVSTQISQAMERIRAAFIGPIKNYALHELERIRKAFSPELPKEQKVDQSDDAPPEYDFEKFDGAAAYSAEPDTIAWCYNILDSFTKFDEKIESMIDTGTKSKADLINAIFKDNLTFQNLKGEIDIANSNRHLFMGDAKELVDQVKESMSSLDLTSGYTMDVTEGEFIIEGLATVERAPVQGLNDDFFGEEAWVSLGGEDKWLSMPYVAMLASTAVYTPLRSKVGDDDYIAALKYLAGSTTGVNATSSDSDETPAEKVVDLFSRVKDFRKPLYVINDTKYIDDMGNIHGTSFSEPYDGPSVRATLGALVTAIEKEKPTIFTIVKGEFMLKEDISSWGFYHANQHQTDDGEAIEKNLSSDDESGSFTPGDESITSSFYTKTLFEIGNHVGTYALTQLVLRNIFNDAKNTSVLDRKKASLLYVNIFGDLVLSDNTIILPGSANPLIFDQEGSYNPYTAAFMNHYPNFAYDADSVHVQNPNDFGKYAFMTDGKGVMDNIVAGVGAGGATGAIAGAGVGAIPGMVIGGAVGLISGIPGMISNSSESNSKIGQAGAVTKDYMKGFGSFTYEGLGIRRIQSEGSFKRTTPNQSLNLYPFFSAGKTHYTFFSFDTDNAKDLMEGGSWYNIADDIGGGTYTVLVKEDAIADGNVTIFPYISDLNRDVTGSAVSRTSNSDYAIPKAIAQNMLWYYTADSEFNSTNTTNGMLREDYIFRTFIVEVLQGVTDVSVYEKNIDIQNAVLGSDTDSGFVWVENVARTILDNIKSIDGILGISSSGTDKLFGRVIMIFRQLSTGLVILFLVMFIFRYMKRGDLLYVVSMSALSGVVVFMMIFVFPNYLPMAYNAVSSLFTEGIVSDTILYKAEQYSTTYGQAGSLDSSNDYSMQTASLTLYNLSEGQIDRLCYQNNIDEEDFRYGDRVIIDQDAGIFVQGNKIKLNTDVLFAGNPITGAMTQGDVSSNAYALTSQKKQQDAIDYYFPFFLMEDGFIETLNSMLKAFKVPRATSNYIDGLVKDSYIVFNYTNSGPFLYGSDIAQFEGEWEPLLYLQMVRAFPDPDDFLNMRGWVENPTSKQRESLWGLTMELNGYYDPNGGKERRAALVEYVNYQTKRYLIENQPLVSMISDENLIKVTALMASFFFNGKISNFGSWVYPTSFNQDEMKLGDVFITTIAGDSDRFIKQNLDLVEYTSNSYGLMGLCILILVMVCSTVFVLVVKISIPILYCLLGVLVVYRFVTDNEFGGLLKGYFKVTGSVIAVYTLFIIVLSVLPSLMSGWGMMVILGMASVLFLWALLTVFIGLMRDITSLGNKGVAEAFRNNPITGVVAQAFDNTYNSIVGLGSRLGMSGQQTYGGSSGGYVYDDGYGGVSVQDDPVGSSATTLGVLNAIDRSYEAEEFPSTPRFTFGRTVATETNQGGFDNSYMVPRREGGGDGSSGLYSDFELSLDQLRREDL